MANISRATALIGILLLAGCAHTYQFNQAPAVSALSGHKLAGKAIAIDVGGVPESYQASAGGHSYNISGVRSSTLAIAQRLFANERIVQDAAAADATLKVALELQLGSSFMGTECKAKARWQIVQASGSVSGEASDAASFPSMANGGNNCEIASLKAIAAALDQALAQLQ